MSLPIHSLNSIPEIIPSYLPALNAQATKKNEAAASLFSAWSDEEKLLHFLHECGVCDEKGRVPHEHRPPSLPPLSAKIKADILTVLQTGRNVQVGETTLKIILAELIASLKADPLIELVGGYSRQQILNDKSYLTDCLIRLTGKSAPELEPLLTPGILLESKRALPDLDVRILCPGESSHELFQKIKGVSDFLAKGFRQPEHWIKKNRTFSKFNVIDLPNVRYSIVSFASIEMIFWAAARRTYLFSIDAFRFSISGHQAALKTEKGLEWQSFIDLLSKVIRIPDPQEVDKMGFPKLISYFSRSYVLGEAEALPIVRETSLMLNENCWDAPAQLALFLRKICRDHHPNDLEAPLILACNASFHLKGAVSAQGLQTLWNDLKEETFKHPLLRLLAEAVNIKHVAVEALLPILAIGAWSAIATRPVQNVISIRNHAGGTALQLFCPDPSHTLLIPLNLKQDLSELKNALKTHKDPEPLLNLLEYVLFRHADQNESAVKPPLPLSGLDLEDTARDYLESSYPPIRYVGFVTLMSLLPAKPSDALIALLFQHLPEMAAFRKNHELQEAFARILEKSGHAATGKLAASYAAGPDWILGLLKSKEPLLIRQAAACWKNSRHLHAAQVELELILNFLTHRIEDGLRFLELHMQDHSSPHPLELSILKQLINRLPTLKPAVYGITDSINKGLQRHSIETLRELPLDHYILFLTDQGHFETARTLLDQALPIMPELQKCWNHWVDTILCDVSTAERLSIDLKVLAANPSPHQEKIYWKAVKKLLRNAATEALGLNVLEHIFTVKGSDDRVSKLALAKLQTQKPTDATAENRYHLLLTPPHLQTLQEHLFHHHLRGRDFTMALAVWKSLNTKPLPLTLKFLEALTENPIGIALAFEVWTMQDRLSILSREESTNYLLRLFDRGEGAIPGLFEKMVETAIEKLPLEIQNALIERILKGLEITFTPLITPHFQTYIEIFQTQHAFSAAERFLTLWNKQLLTIPLELFPFCQEAARHYLKLANVEKSFFWLDQAAACSHPKDFSAWIGASRAACSRPLKAKFYLKYAAELREAVAEEIVTKEACAIALKKETLAEEAHSLLQIYGPDTVRGWFKLFQEGNPLQIHLAWPPFFRWICSQPLNKDHEYGLLGVLTCLAKGKENSFIFLELLTQALEDSSPFYTHFRPTKLWSGYCLEIMKNTVSTKKAQPSIIALIRLTDAEQSTQTALEVIDILLSCHCQEFFLPAYSLLLQRIVNRRSGESIAPFIKPALTIIREGVPYESGAKSQQIIELLQCLCLLLGTSSIGDNDLFDLALELSKYSSPPPLRFCLNVIQSLKAKERPKALHAPFISSCTLKYVKALDLSDPANHEYAFEVLLQAAGCKSDAKIYTEMRDLACTLAAGKILTGSPNVFSQWVYQFFVHFAGSEFKLIDVRDTPPPFNDCPIVIYPVRNLRNPRIEKDEIPFIECLSLLLDKLIKSSPETEIQQIFLNFFLHKNLLELCRRFPEKKLKLNSLLEAYIFRLEPRPNAAFNEHLRYAKILLMEAFRLKIYEGYSNELHEQMLFLDKHITLPLDKKILVRVINRMLRISSPYAIVYASKIMQGCQFGLLQKAPETLLLCYRKLFEHIPQQPFYTFLDLHLFEWLRRSLLEKDSAGHIAAGCFQNPRFATQICSLLADKVLEIYPLITTESPLQKIQLTDWFFRFLLDADLKGAFRCPEGKIKIVALMHRLVAEAIQAPKKDPSFENLVSQAIMRLCHHDPKQHKALMEKFLSSLSAD